MAFTTPIDVANRALQHLGIPRIATFTDSSKQAREIAFNYDKLRRSELRRAVWTFATRRAVMRAVVATTETMIFTAYSAATTYAAGDVVKDSAGYLWLSTAAGNIANTPGAGGVNTPWTAYFGPLVAQLHDVAVQYFPGDVVYISTVVYICVAPSLNHAPPNATYWHVMAGTTAAVTVQLSPLGYSPDGTTVRNIYRIPANFIRIAPQDPKFPAGIRQNVTAGMQYNDWEFEAHYLFTADAAPIVMRFVADQADVTTMDDLFCEVWAARMAMELCEPLTQSAGKMQEVSAEYVRYMTDALTIDAIEAGTTEEDPRIAASLPPSNRLADRNQQAPQQ